MIAHMQCVRYLVDVGDPCKSTVLLRECKTQGMAYFLAIDNLACFPFIEASAAEPSLAFQ